MDLSRSALYFPRSLNQYVQKMHQPMLAATAALSLSFSNAFAQVQDLGSPPGGRLIMTAISDDGSILLGSAIDPVLGEKAAIWTEDGGLMFLVGAVTDDFLGFGLSDDGSLAVGFQSNAPPTGFGYLAAVWDTVTNVRTDIPPLPGETVSYSTLISSDGSTVAGVSGDTLSRPFRWTAAGGTQEILLPVNTHSRVYGVSQDGTVIIGDYDPPSGGSLGWIWTLAGGTQSIPGLNNWSPRDMSDDGQVIVGVTGDPGFSSRIFYYQMGSAPVEIPLGTTLPGGPPLLVSADGSTVAGMANFATGTTGFTWTASGGTVIIGAGLGTQPYSISGDGSVVVGATSSFGGTQAARPFRWDSDGLEFLEGLTPGSYAAGLRVSRDGTAVSGYALSASGDIHGALWRDSGLLGASVCDPALPNSTGVAGGFFLTGTNAIARGDLTLRAASLPANVTTLFLVSRSSASPMPVAGSQGQICLGASFGMLLGPGQLQNSGPAGVAELTLDVSNLPAPLGGAVPGESLFFQAWHRDSNPTATSNLTSAATVRVF